MLDGRTGRWAAALAMVAVVGVTGCETEGGEAEPGEVPEMAEVEPEDLSEGEVEFQEALPLTADDVGDVMLVTGTVVGMAIPDGFFVATEGGEVLFVATDEVAVPGEAVSVTGTLQAVQVPVFDEWEADALEGEVEAEWDLVRAYYIDAGSVATPS